jgi:hypothetical protein
MKGACINYLLLCQGNQITEYNLRVSVFSYYCVLLLDAYDCLARESAKEPKKNI